MAAEDHLSEQFGSYAGKHRYTGPTKAVPVYGSRLHAGSDGPKMIGAAEVQPSHEGPVHKYRMGRHEAPGRHTG